MIIRTIIILLLSVIVPGTYAYSAALARLGRVPGTAYTSLQQAYDAAIDGDLIQMQSGWYEGNVNLNRAINVIIEGGYNSNFTVSTGAAAMLAGAMQSTYGKATLDNFILTTHTSGTIFTPSSVTISPPSADGVVYAGTSTQFVVALQGGIPSGMEFRFSINNSVVQDWSTQATCNWTPSSPGEYTLKVEARYQQNWDTYTMNFYVFRRPVQHPN